MRICGKHIAFLTLASLALAGCGSEGGDSSLDRNTPPHITGTPPTTLVAGTPYSFTPTAVDPDGDPLTFNASNVPSWATFNTSTGALSGTPDEANVGMTQSIQIEVSDSKAVVQLPPFRIQVTSNSSAPPPGNVAPTISGTPATTAVVNQSYTFTPVGADANGDTLTYSIANRPSWLTFTPATGALTGTPGSANVGSTGNIIITVSDGQATADLQFSITVSAATQVQNRPPTITGTPPTSVTVGSQYSFQPVGSDPDGNTLRYSIQNQPSWMEFNTSTGRLRGTPTAANVGTSARITITVTDGNLTASLPSFTILVSAAANRPPAIGGTPLTSVNVLTAYSFQPTASDPDGNALTFSIQNAPSWATFSASTGRLSGTPQATDVGSYSNIIISVSDGTASATLPAFSLAVVQTASGTAVLNWSAPTTNSDGSSLSDLAGYRVAYGRAASALDQSATVNTAGVTTYTVGNLTSGQWYFAVYAVNSRGLESDISNVATKTIP